MNRLCDDVPTPGRQSETTFHEALAPSGSPASSPDSPWHGASASHTVSASEAGSSSDARSPLSWENAANASRRFIGGGTGPDSETSFCGLCFHQKLYGKRGVVMVG